MATGFQPNFFLLDSPAALAVSVVFAALAVSVVFAALAPSVMFAPLAALAQVKKRKLAEVGARKLTSSWSNSKPIVS
jgi:uncharacterized protein YhdP